ncbi:MAG: phosphoribosyl-AMP cyclohydrolase [Erythrobacter sp.]|uniref:phosphoribosyl-AMP cyclohydrolase n=1 Tax=Erythrobacter sp. TaxID=1042 RepID=UPI003C76C33A
MELNDASALSASELEHGTRFAPRFDADGLIPCVVLDHLTKEALVLAYMNAESLEATRRTGEVHFWSRSRGRLWKKGETSGNVLSVERIFVDCDQDALVVHAVPAGPTCHTGARSCFYRELDPEAEDESALHHVLP